LTIRRFGVISPGQPAVFTPAPARLGGWVAGFPGGWVSGWLGGWIESAGGGHRWVMVLSWPAVRRRIEVHGPRPAGEVWDCYVRPRHWPRWSPQIRSVDYPHAIIEPGTTGVVHGPLGLPVAFRIRTVDPTPPVLTWSWSATVAGVPMLL
jgi:hypothetical protein